MKNPAAAFIKPKSNVMNPLAFGHGDKDEMRRSFHALPMRQRFGFGVADHGKPPAFGNPRILRQVPSAPGGVNMPEQSPTIKRFGAGRAGNPRLANQPKAKRYIGGFHKGGKRSESYNSVGNFKFKKSTGTARPETWASETVTF